MSRSSQNRKGGGAGGPQISGAEVFQMNVRMFERARDSGDDHTARRCLDAMDRMVADLRAQQGGGGGEPSLRGGGNVEHFDPAKPGTYAYIANSPGDDEPSSVVVDAAAAVAVDYDEIERRVGIRVNEMGRYLESRIIDIIPPRPAPESDWRLLVVLPWRWFKAAGRIVRRVWRTRLGER